MKQTTRTITVAMTLAAMLAGCAGTQKSKTQAQAQDLGTEQAVKTFIADHVAKLKPLYKQETHAWWDASITGSKEAFEKRQAAENALNELYSNKEDFAKIKGWLDGGQVKNPQLKRQLEILYRTYLPKQVDKELLAKMVKLGAEVEQIFNTHRSKVGDKELTENQVRKILSTSSDSNEVKAAWEAYYAVGGKVEAKLKELVKLRNESARKLGYPNFYAMQLTTQEFTEKELLTLFDELDTLTAEPFAKAKAEIDSALAKKFNVSVKDLQHWHYQDLFFKEAPAIYPVDLDSIYGKTMLETVIADYYRGIGLDADDIMKRGDLYEKKGKSPHAFCIDMDREGDVRILTNLQNDARWADTLLHELGHAVYDKFIDHKQPYLLRGPAHILTTEGVAMLFGRMAKNGRWMEQALKLAPEKAKATGDTARKTMRLEALVFSRWAQVMMRFEHAMYNNPDQDLSKLWWNLKKKYQLLTPPQGRNAPDYAAKIHVVIVPAYYHNYQLGALFASQVHRHITTNVLKQQDPFNTSYVGKPEVGAYFKEKIFKPAAAEYWNTMVEQATGEKLSPKHFAADFVQQ